MNRLIHALSPYLLQHAHNPVDWQEWSDSALQQAKSENKPILVSIGYSACHWCHVMEKESFEDAEVAKIMNQNYVCIKIDREERPDLDAIYMEAAQAFGSNGGWPLHAFLTPEGKPFYGGTYFPKHKWIEILQRLADIFRERPQEVLESAEKVTAFLRKKDSEKYKLYGDSIAFKKETVAAIYDDFSQHLDSDFGGFGSAPKFPMPVYYEFLLQYLYLFRKEEAAIKATKEHLIFSLDQMIFGGIYDQIGGGFARYAVDNEWFLPHFEKMLYDNAQLIGLYAQAYALTGLERYKETVYQTVEFLERELKNKEGGGFYSALDADSEGEEGKFYVWKETELVQILGESDFQFVRNYYHTTAQGNWHEAQANILFRNQTDADFASVYGWEVEKVKEKVKQIQTKLFHFRQKRIPPHTDDKILTSWNALTIKGLCEAYFAFGEERWKDLALETAHFIETQMRSEGKLLHTYRKGQARIEAFLEDYAALIEAYIWLYQATFDEKWLERAAQDVAFTLAHFWDSQENLFFFNAQKEKSDLIAQKKEIFDNVIPASNSLMAKNLHFLGLLLHKPEWTELSEKMLFQVFPLVQAESRYLANWAALYAIKTSQTAEIAIVGADFREKARQIQRHFIPNKIVAATDTESALPLLKGRNSAETLIFVCKNYTCQLPQKEVAKALELL
jgi:uncharacterized protein YyaL (SSP411 family)